MVLAATALACHAAGAGPVLDRIRQAGTIVLAHRESSVPFSYVGPNGQPIGYALDLCTHIAEAVRKQLGLPALARRYVQITPANRVQFIAQGRADLECGSTTNTAERREQVSFTVPHYITGARYLVRADSGIEKLEDFEGKRVVSVPGTAPMKAIVRANAERLLRITVIEAPDLDAATAMVESGQAEGFVMDDVLLYGQRAKSRQPGSLQVVGKFLTIDPLAIMLPKGDAEFKKLVDAELRRLIYSGEARAMYERWFVQPIPPKNESLNLPMSYLLKDFWKYPTDQVPY
ncbi:amino acid ABC transporter substrate-binding protein [Schlegelella sp. S2-27]|uniref:Amino acid ABC transporter substrate-binding protein n=2 Tax=Caldimonas mangrovi TaxID=2944811 RepID=A0ABT0YV98_9BURK|nr:amino acid ABC transporter substrate-binding protein [Caldimonas mangrovi]MCM5681723.1 amino acid ABC transporter substrate-binding protein [Caldimonas mangrovi]